MSQGGGRRWRLVRAHTDAVPTSVRRLMAAARRRAGTGRRAWALAGGTAALVVLAVWVVWASPLLALTQVQVTGTDLLAPADVREAAGVPDGTPLPRVRTDEVADRVATLAPVARVEVSRSWPRTLVIDVTERTAVAAVPLDDGYGWLDATGTVFHDASGAPPGVPALELSEPGPDDPATAAALVVLGALTPELHARLDTVVVAGPARIRLELSDGSTVVWGDESASEEKARVATALLDRDAAVIDVSAPEVVVLR
jgi:cell division protein FtsQ